MRTFAIASFLVWCVLGVQFVGVAAAEPATARPPAGRLEQRDAAPGPGAGAPVGHRQPQVKDLSPGEMPPADEATRDLDKALAKKLTICRGC